METDILRKAQVLSTLADIQRIIGTNNVSKSVMDKINEKSLELIKEI